MRNGLTRTVFWSATISLNLSAEIRYLTILFSDYSNACFLRPLLRYDNGLITRGESIEKSMFVLLCQRT
jgi:hypothetical protein